MGSDRLRIDQEIEVAHLDGRGGIYWLAAIVTSAAHSDGLRDGHERSSYKITLAPPGWGGIPFGAVPTVDEKGTYWRRPTATGSR